MKRIVLTVAIFLGLLSGVSSQQTPENKLVIPEGKSIWLNSAPDAEDMIEMYSRSDEERYGWNELRQYIDVVHYYQGNVMLYPSQNFMRNSYTHLSERGFFRNLKEVYKLRTSMEVGAIKWFACDWSKNDLLETARFGAESVSLVYKAGGEVNYLTIDSSLPGGFECTKRELSVRDMGQMVALWMKDLRSDLVKQGVPAVPLSIGDVEPYPYVDVAVHKWYIDIVNSEARRHGIPGFSHYHADVDMRAVKDYPKMQRDLLELATYVKSRGMRFGIIMNGVDTDSVTEYFDSLNQRLVVMTSLGILDMADNIVIQSWAMSSDKRQHLPSNVPESEPFTQTNFALHLLNCAVFKTPGWDCERYPQPRN